MENTNYNSENQFDFKVIVLRHLSRILEISSHELRDQTKVSISANQQTILEAEDTRLSYIQAVESLASILYPYFDDTMKKQYIEFDKLYDILISDFKEQYKEEISKLTEDKLHSYLLYKKLKLARKVFRELNLLLRRIDYLNSSIFGEEKEEQLVEDSEEDSE